MALMLHYRLSCFFIQDKRTKCFTDTLILQFYARYTDILQVASPIGYEMCKTLPEMHAFAGIGIWDLSNCLVQPNN